MEDNLINQEEVNDEVKPPKKKNNAVFIVALVIAFIGIFVVGIVVGYFTKGGLGNKNPIVNEVYELAKKYYYEDITKDDVDRMMAAGMISVLDPYTGLVVANEPEERKFGFTMSTDEYSVKIVEDVKEGGVVYGHIMRGDRVLAIRYSATGEWIDVEHMTNKAFNQLLSTSTPIQFKMDRAGEEVILGPFVKKAFNDELLANYLDTGVANIGYIKLDSFRQDAAYDFMSAIYDFEHSGNNVLILDLRDNPGGSTAELAKIVNNFIPNPSKKDAVISIKAKKGMGGVTYAEKYDYDDGMRHTSNSYIGDKIKKNTGKDFKMVVVANGDSASAAEAFIGNIKHYMDSDDYIIIGEDARTYGKGIAQANIPLKSDKNLVFHVTIGYYYVLGEKGTSEENEDVNIHGVGYTLDNAGIKTERKANILEEDAIVKAIERATLKFL